MSILGSNRFFVMIIVALCYAVNLNLLSKIKKPKIERIKKDDRIFNIQDEYLQVFHFGQKRFFSALFWVHTLLEADETHYKGDDYKNWLFLRFKSISLIDPKFYENYRYGGLYLSIIKDDDLGAKFIYDKGLSFYPSDYNLLYFSAFHYYFELGDYKGAIELYKRLLNLPGSLEKFPLLPNILSRLEATEGDLVTAYQVLLSSYQALPENSLIREKYASGLYALKAEIDLDCLHKKPNHQCDKLDFFGEPYLQTGEGYKAKQSWQKFRRFH